VIILPSSTLRSLLTVGGQAISNSRHVEAGDSTTLGKDQPLLRPLFINLSHVHSAFCAERSGQLLCGHLFAYLVKT
jgi:hypothetical protein